MEQVGKNRKLTKKGEKCNKRIIPKRNLVNGLSEEFRDIVVGKTGQRPTYTYYAEELA